MSGFRRGVRLGVDVGSVRVGVARSDPDGLLAVPVETVPRDDKALARVVELADEHGAIELVVGLPVSLRGGETASTADARQFARDLARASTGSERTVRLVDERLSTTTAHDQLRSAGRSQKSSRKMVDQVAAVVILQHAIDVEKGRGSAPGHLVTAEDVS
ncbi:Holliday junction resolvase RuvX [uncultured Microbacterium sp.]|uniref:Holliday junction resolvase RuvX n=1 Tax=uncultured Microbacterium sp. TaxID=191216 RepID=UPI0025E6BAFF|nr:Holliday junction resolvase RuvX [uncultured Microbacterium sp.]